jgi:hypothetical protein
MMILSLPSRIAVSELAYERLLQGEVPESMAVQLKTNAMSLQNFVDGEDSLAVAAAMACPRASVQELRRCLGREGAIGLLIGLCVAAKVAEAG